METPSFVKTFLTSESGYACQIYSLLFPNCRTLAHREDMYHEKSKNRLRLAEKFFINHSS